MRENWLVLAISRVSAQSGISSSSELNETTIAMNAAGGESARFALARHDIYLKTTRAALLRNCSALTVVVASYKLNSAEAGVASSCALACPGSK